MRPAILQIALIGSIVAVSVILTAAASTFALARAQVERLDGDMASVIRADYSADPEGTSLAPLEEGITDAVRLDEARLREDAPGVEIVPVSYTSSAEESTSSASPTQTQVGTPTPSPGTTLPPGDALPPDETPPPGITPPNPGPGPTPGSTLTPPPAPAPTPPPSGVRVFYLHNDPHPPTGDTASQPVLSIDLATPTATALYNYDTDRDAFPGLLIAKGALGAGETDPTKYQAWRSPVLTSDLTIQGGMVVQLWSAMKEFQQGKRGTATVYLRDFDGSSYTEIATHTVADPDWQRSSSTWVLKTFVIGVGNYTLPVGHRLELKLVVDNKSNDDMWFAYDTVEYSSRFTIPSK